MTEKFNVTGMTCSACSARVEKALGKLEGVEAFSVNLLTHSMSVTYQSEVTSSHHIISSVEKAGYGASLFQKDSNPRDPSEKNSSNIAVQPLPDKDNFPLRLRVSFLFLLPLMYVSMGHMWNLPQFAFLEGIDNAVSLAFTQFLLTLPICYVNRHYFFGGFRAFFRGSANMDSLVALGASAAFIYGVFAIYRMSYALGSGDTTLLHQYYHDLYFESCGTILALITLGKYFEAKSKEKTSEALEKLINLAPKMAIVEKDGQEVEIESSQLQVGDLVLVKSGASIPTDGVVEHGQAMVDQSSLTGESIPVTKEVGDTVLCSTLNTSGFLKVRVTKASGDTVFSQIIALVEEASSSKAPISQLADRISGIFVPVVLGISLLTGFTWLSLGYSLEHSLSFAITVLVISCPCALGLATPVAIMVGTGKGAQLGILVKSGEALETAHAIDTILLDKTGTITQGKPEVTDLIALSGSCWHLLSLATSLEKQSQHPLGKAIVQYGESQGVDSLEITDFQDKIGRGVLGTHENTLYFGGNEALFQEYCQNSTCLAPHKPLIDQLGREGKAPLLFGTKDQLLGIIAVADPLKLDSKEALSQLKSMGLSLFMVTGDKKETAEYIASTLPLDGIEAEVLPQDKEAMVQKYQSMGKKVAMVGDGINDAPALIRADLGIAMGNGTDIALESGDIILMNGSLSSLVTSLSLSKKVLKTIKQNLFWAFFYNGLGIPLAAGLFYLPFGWRLTPMFAAMAMSMSSLFVVLHALGLKHYKGKELIVPSLDASNLEKNVVFIREGENLLESLEISKNQSNNYKNKENTPMITLNIEGMMCQRCVAHVNKALASVENATEIAVLLEENKATVQGDAILLDALVAAVEEAGYDVTSTTITE